MPHKIGVTIIISDVVLKGSLLYSCTGCLFIIVVYINYEPLSHVISNFVFIPLHCQQSL